MAPPLVIRQSELVGVELRGAVLLRDLRATDRSDFLALADDEAMFEYTKFRLDEAMATWFFEQGVREPSLGERRRWDLAIESPRGEFAGWVGRGPVGS